jgi:hypothetical protein
MIVFNVEQGTPEWHEARAGKITASMFAEVRKVVNGLSKQQQDYVNAIRVGFEPDNAAEVAGYAKPPTSQRVQDAIDGKRVGDFSETAKRYAFRVALERRHGKVLGAEQFDTWAMKRGHELEARARLLHEEKIDTLVQHCGFVCTDDELYGASCDGLIGDDTVAEYKAFTDPGKLLPIIVYNDLSDVMDQIQGQMWIAKRKLAHFALYVPELGDDEGLILKIVERDDAYIEDLVRDLKAFNELVDLYAASIDSAFSAEKVTAAIPEEESTQEVQF